MSTGFIRGENGSPCWNVRKLEGRPKEGAGMPLHSRLWLRVHCRLAVIAEADSILVRIPQTLAHTIVMGSEPVRVPLFR